MSREVMQQALEALVDVVDMFAGHYRDEHIPENETNVPLENIHAAIESLGAALAEQAAEQEVPGCWRLVGSDDGMRHPEACDLVGGETDMPAEQAEPVAWQWLDTSTFRKRLPSNAEPGAWRPLYAANCIK